MTIPLRLRLLLVAGITTVLIGGCGATPEPFSFIVVDDVHYAASEDYDWDSLDSHDATMAARVRRTVQKSEATFLPFLQELKEQSETAIPGAVAIFSCGDLIHGAVAVKADAHCEHFIRLFESVGFSIPLFNANGNHEMAEAGMEEAYDRNFLPFLSRQAERDISSRHFSWEYGDAAFILLDGLPPDRDGGDHEARIWALQDAQWQWLERQLETYRDKEHIFVFSHAPLFPVSNGDVLYAFDKERFGAFIDLMLRYNIRVLFAGHQHKNCVVVYEEGEKQLIQMIPNSDLPSVDIPSADPVITSYDVETVVPNSERQWDIHGRELVASYRENVVYFEHTPRMAGYFLISVDGPAVTVRMFRGTGKKMYREYTIIADAETGATRFQ